MFKPLSFLTKFLMSPHCIGDPTMLCGHLEREAIRNYWSKLPLRTKDFILMVQHDGTYWAIQRTQVPEGLQDRLFLDMERNGRRMFELVIFGFKWNSYRLEDIKRAMDWLCLFEGTRLQDAPRDPILTLNPTARARSGPSYS